MPRTKRKDKSRVVLRTGESQRADGTYHFSWTDANHKRRYVYHLRTLSVRISRKCPFLFAGCSICLDKFQFERILSE